MYVDTSIPYIMDKFGRTIQSNNRRVYTVFRAEVMNLFIDVYKTMKYIDTKHEKSIQGLWMTIDNLNMLRDQVFDLQAKLAYI